MKRALIFGTLTLCFANAHAIEPTYRNAETLSTKQKLDQSNTAIKSMKATLKTGVARLQEAKGRQDILQVNCVDDKLQAIQALLNISEDAGRGIKEAAARKDDEMINHEFTKISFTATRVENFRTELEGCMGEASQYTGKTVVDTVIDGDIRADDPANADNDPVFVPVMVDLERPEPISGSE